MPQDVRIGVGVACLVIRMRPHVGEWQILLGKRKGSHGAGLWSTPGGWMEYGEEFLDTAFRELEEETGLRPNKLVRRRPLCVQTHTLEGRQFVTVYQLFWSDARRSPAFHGVASVKEPDKCEEWCWFNLDCPPGPLMAGVGDAIRQAQLFIENSED